MASIKGRVIEQTTEGADEDLKKLAKKYLGIGKYYYRKPHHRRIIIKIKPEKVLGLSIHPAFYFLAQASIQRHGTSKLILTMNMVTGRLSILNTTESLSTLTTCFSSMSFARLCLYVYILDTARIENKSNNYRKEF